MCLSTGMSITTIEGLGSRKEGYHPLQKQLANHNGSQCGFCSPGIVMTMYSLLQNKSSPTKKEIEDHFDGNLCRCTGYRPILDAMNTFASDFVPPKSSCSGSKKQSDVKKCCTKENAPPLCCSSSSSSSLSSLCARDIEDLSVFKPKPSVQKKQADVSQFLRSSLPKRSTFRSEATDSDSIPDQYFHAVSMEALFQLMQLYPASDRKLIVGNTSIGIYKKQHQPIYIDIRDIEELNVTVIASDGVKIGAATTITKLIGILQEAQQDYPDYRTLWYSKLIDHLLRVANFQIRNTASWAGNLMLVHDHLNFPSDIYVIMMAARAQLIIADATSTQQVTLEQFLSFSMENRVIVSLLLPYASSPNEKMETYKVALRHQNAHALVNAAMCITVDPSSFIVLSQPSLIFGGISQHPIHAQKTEQFLTGNTLTNSSTLSQACSILQQELVPDLAPGKVAYRNSAACSFFYKFYLTLLPSLPPSLLTTSGEIKRPLSHGTQSYDSDPIEYPISEYIPKLDGILQTSGEAQYNDDSFDVQSMVHGCFVVSDRASATIQSIDASEALKMPGVIDFFSASDIAPGCNNCETNVGVPSDLCEQVFASPEVVYNGQSVGLIVADSERHAIEASKKVLIKYSDVKKSILTMSEAISQNSYFPQPNAGLTPVGPYIVGDVEQGFSQSDVVFSGQVEVGGQYHFHMETHTCTIIPEKDGKFTVRSSTQWTSMTQQIIARVLDIPINMVSVGNKRLGGAYGGKITRPVLPAAAAAVASNKLNLPVRVRMDLNDNMEIQGKRHPFLCKYKVGVNVDGKIQALQIDYYDDGGAFFDAVVGTMDMALQSADNAYYFPNYKATGYCLKTNNAPNTSCRAPGCLSSIFFVEYIIENTAATLSMSSKQLRELNFYSQGQVTPYGTPLLYYSLPEVWQQVQQTSDFDARQMAVNEFNKLNRWKKRGISIVPIKYGIAWFLGNFGAEVNVQPDGTVQLSHGGVEVGQGIDTKLVQVLAYELSIDMSQITVCCTNTQKTPNNQSTGGSITSELCAQAIIQAANEINQRLAPIKAISTDKSWVGVISKAASLGINITGRGWSWNNAPAEGPFAYNTYGSAVSEVEIDVLTGETQIVRSDILYDCGQSLNPAIDIGQVLGGYVMALGYWLTEQLVYSKDGKLTSNGTWEYKPPGFKDIPVDIRVSLLKNAPNPLGVLSSKASGEPPMCMACSLYFATRNAVQAALENSGITSKNPLPATPDSIQQSCQVQVSQFSFQ